MRTRLVASLACAIGVAGCTVGPDYARPKVPAPDAYYGQNGPGGAASLADRPWWDVFPDPPLRALIDESLTNGWDARIAAARVEQARARWGVAGSYVYPSVGYGANATQGHTSFYATPSDTTGHLFSANVSASWEIDLWGRVRRLNESARAQYLSSEEARGAVALSLVSEVAIAYFELRELDAELEIARHARDTFQDTFDLFTRRLEGGTGTALETSRAEALLANAAAQVPAIEQRIVAKENQIAYLVGRLPGPIPRGAALADQPLPPSVPAGLPASLLARRPDLRRAEQDLIAANANVGVARAALYPTISLTGLLGGQSTALTDLLVAGKMWTIGAGLLGPLFQGGRLRAQEREAHARLDEARTNLWDPLESTCRHASLSIL